MRYITSKFEINILQSTKSPLSACNYAAKNNCQAVVVDNPAFIPPMHQNLLSTRGNYKCILAVDFPLGKNYGFANKFRMLTEEAWGADGFDILLSARNDIESANEISGIVTQLRSVSPGCEIRFTIDAFSRSTEVIIPILKAIKANPVNMIRLDHHVEYGQDLTDEKIEEVINLVREYTPIPIKLSTNVTMERVEKFKDRCAMFDVTPAQATAIVKEYQTAEAL